MLLRLLICFGLISVRLWSEDHTHEDVDLMTMLANNITTESDAQAIAACQQVVIEGERLRVAYASLNTYEPGGPRAIFYRLKSTLMKSSQSQVPGARRRWSAMAFLALRQPEDIEYPADLFALAGRLADPVGANRIIAWNEAGNDEAGRLFRRLIAASRERPQRVLRVDGAASAGTAVTWDWTWMPQGLGFWWTGALPTPQRVFTAIERPLVIDREGSSGMFGSRTGGGRRKTSLGHPLETWRMVTPGAADLSGSRNEAFSRTGLLRVGWPRIRNPQDMPVPIDEEATKALTIGAPGLDGDWTEVAILPPARTPTLPGIDPTLTAHASDEVLTVRLNGGTVAFAVPKLDRSTLWMLAVAENGRPTLVISNNQETTFTVALDGSLPATMAALEPGTSWETTLDLSALPSGRHRLWVGFGPVTWRVGFANDAWAIPVWKGELIAGPIPIERTAPTPKEP